MGKLVILNGQGHAEVEWDSHKAATGDPEAQAAVREAERVIEEYIKKGAAVFAVMPGTEQGERIYKFNPEEKREIVIVPQMQGG
ncbi:hypothetical protein HY404_00080 [Candidatus Microgenomates bacterium]|nr:hypothetical protein [Candidatus Microgenomates bacterium]